MAYREYTDDRIEKLETKLVSKLDNLDNKLDQVVVAVAVLSATQPKPSNWSLSKAQIAAIVALFSGVVGAIVSAIQAMQ